MGQTAKKPYHEICLAAAERGEAQALYDLGLLYSTGQGVDLDYVIAHKWFNLAAMRGVRRAVVDRAELARDMTEEEIARAQRMAREWQHSHTPRPVREPGIAVFARHRDLRGECRP